MFKLMFGFISGIVFSVLTIALGLIGIAIGVELEDDLRKKKASAHPAPSK